PAAFALAAPNPALSPVATEGALAASPVVNETTPRFPIGDAKGGPPLNRPTLVREIQRQLKRIGCYRGDLSGVWTPAVRDAMKAFTERVNASLPVEQPAPVLLAMVQSQAAGTCSASCPPGQARAANGRCMPSALAANTVAANSGKERGSDRQPR